MIRWIIDWFRRRRSRKARELFVFFDGQRTRRMDPFSIQWGLTNHPTFRLDMLDLVMAGEPEETAHFEAAVCDSFGVHRWNPDTEKGLTRPELIRLFNDFDDYCDEVKKKYNLGPTLPEPTESKSSTDSTDNSPSTKLSSGFITTQPELSCDAPPP